MSIFTLGASALINRVSNRPPDFVIGGHDRPYLLRWWLLPRNPILNIYLHKFMRDDDDRALHDHPWPWASILLRNRYREHTIISGGVHHRQLREAGSIRVATPWRAHRVELELDADGNGIPCWTMFITGPRLRTWGFHCPERGWVRWQDFVAKDDRGAIGPGCGDEP